MKLNIENTSYTLNVERAVALGVLTADRVLITSISAGDKVQYRTSSEIETVIQISYHNDKYDSWYILGGCKNNPFHAYSMPPRTLEEFIRYLNNNSYSKVT